MNRSFGNRNRGQAEEREEGKPEVRLGRFPASEARWRGSTSPQARDSELPQFLPTLPGLFLQACILATRANSELSDAGTLGIT
jgi:hypothetical protein